VCMSVEIKKLRTNFEVRFQFNKGLNEYIKSLPKDQQQTKMDSIRKDDGTVFQDWYRVVNEAGLSKIIDFIKANNIKFKFTNMELEDIEKLKQEFVQRQTRGEEALKARAKDLDVSDFKIPNMVIQPYDYQKQAVMFFEKADGRCLLGDQPGVGKTLSAIAYAVKNKLKTLVVCPASLKLNWRNEIQRFTNEKAFIYKYKPKKRSKEIVSTKEESLFHIINYEALETFIKLSVSHRCTYTQCGWKETNIKKKYDACPQCQRQRAVKSRVLGTVFQDKDGVSLDPNSYDLIVCDEAHYLKNPKTNRTKVIKKAFMGVPKKLLLTGTAIKSVPYEFFSLLNFIDPAEWKSAHQFGVRYCAGFQDDFGWDYSGSSNLDELYSRISPYFLRRLKSDVLSFLPPKTFTHLPIELTTEEYREYSQIEKKVVEESGEDTPDADHLSRIQRLKMFTSQVKALRGIELVHDIIDGDEKVVVFTEYLSTADKIKNHFGDKAVLFTGQKSAAEKQEAVDKFMNDDNVRIFVGTIGAAGVGITLTIASTAVFIDQPWTPSDREQAEDRIHRASTTSDKVQIIRLICQDTIDEKIISLLRDKEKVTSMVLDATIIDKKVQRLQGSIFRELVALILDKKKDNGRN
jgi:SWI/SNF-related matrix-associated actin-dependent regulator 1 of chromatin subfamily A